VHLAHADVDMRLPDELDLTAFTGRGLQPDETELPEDIEAPAAGGEDSSAPSSLSPALLAMLRGP